MLDFMDDQIDRDEDGQVEAPLDSSLAQEDQDSNADHSQNGDGEFLTTSVDQASVKKSTMILIAIFIVVAGSLMLMIKSATPQSATAAQATQTDNQIEIAIAKLSGIKADIFSKMDDIARKFEEASDIEQVEVSQLKKNPFGSNFLANSVRKSRQSNNSGSYFQLDSIIQSDDGNFCMIDGDVYNQGDTVQSYLVKEIGKDFVRLVSDSDVKILKINMQ